MSIFSKRASQRSEPEDLDSGYENPYYTVREDRRDDRRDDRRVERRDRAEEDYYDTRRVSDRAPAADRYEEEEPRGYRERMYEEEQPVRARAEKVEEPAAPVNKGTLYYTPESYRDVRVEIVTAVADSHVVVVNIRNLVDEPDMVRLIDYVMGAAQVLGATLRRLGGNNLLLVPKDVEVDEDDILITDDEDVEDEEEEEYYDEEEYEEEYEEDGEAYDEE